MKVLFDAFNYTTDEVSNLSIQQINAAFRAKDESRLWPICGKFNATERAIRRLRNLRRAGLEVHPGYEYCLALRHEISNIVNSL